MNDTKIIESRKEKGKYMLLVTGITGHTGRFFLQELRDHKFVGIICCVVRPTSTTSCIDNSGLSAKKVAGDLYDESFIEHVTKDVETNVHIYNIHHSPAIVEAALINHVKRVILDHTTGIYSKFKNASQNYINIDKLFLKCHLILHV